MYPSSMTDRCSLVPVPGCGPRLGRSSTEKSERTDHLSRLEASRTPGRLSREISWRRLTSAHWGLLLRALFCCLEMQFNVYQSSRAGQWSEHRFNAPDQKKNKIKKQKERNRKEERKKKERKEGKEEMYRELLLLPDLIFPISTVEVQVLILSSGHFQNRVAWIPNILQASLCVSGSWCLRGDGQSWANSTSHHLAHGLCHQESW